MFLNISIGISMLIDFTAEIAEVAESYEYLRVHSAHSAYFAVKELPL
jgi:hypothetical protein